MSQDRTWERRPATMHDEDKKDEVITPSPSEEIVTEEPTDKKEEVPTDIDFEKEAELLDIKPTPKPKRSPQEEVAFNLKKNAERAQELGVDPREVLGLEDKVTDKPDTSEFITKSDMARDLARGLTQSEAELKVVMWQYEHGIQRTGDIQMDVENALFLAHKPRLKGVLAEIKRGNDAIPPKGDGGTASQKKVEVVIPKLTSEEQIILRRRGFNLDPKTGEWVAKHNKMVYNTATKSWDTVKIVKA